MELSEGDRMRSEDYEVRSPKANPRIGACPAMSETFEPIADFAERYGQASMRHRPTWQCTVAAVELPRPDKARSKPKEMVGARKRTIARSRSAGDVGSQDAAPARKRRPLLQTSRGARRQHLIRPRDSPVDNCGDNDRDDHPLANSIQRVGKITAAVKAGGRRRGRASSPPSEPPSVPRFLAAPHRRR
jgi:hypothetical protein